MKLVLSFLVVTLLVGADNRTRALQPSHLADQIAAGRALYASNCEVCHGDRTGEGRVSGVPPHGAAGHTWAHSDDQLVGVILSGLDYSRLEPSPGQPTPTMPPWRGRLSEAEIRAIIAYISTWWTPEQRAMRGALAH